MSRLPAEEPDLGGTQLTLLVLEPIAYWVQKLKEEKEVDEWILQKKEQISRQEARKEFSIQGGLLIFRDRYCMGPNSKLITEILKELHDSKIEGYSSYFRTLYRIRQRFYWVGMRKQIKKFVVECLTCQQIKIPADKPLGLLLPLNIPMAIWEEVSVDFITGLSPVQGHSVIIVVVDRLSKYCHLGSLPETYSTKAVANYFTENIVRLHGIPMKLVSDRDRVFLSKFWQELLRQSGTSVNMSSAYHLLNSRM